MNVKTLIFHVHFFNMNISLFIAPICLKICMCIAEVCMEGSLSHNFDIGLTFFYIYYVEEGILKKGTKNHKSYPFFIIKLKLGPKRKNVFTFSKFCTCRLNIK